MAERLNSEQPNDDKESPWCDLAEAIEQTKQEWKDAAGEKATRHFKEIYEIEMDFARRNENLAAAGDEMSQKEFERWEDAVADEVKPATEEIQRGEMKLRDKAEIFQHMIAYRKEEDLKKTIEAQSGKYYIERDNELRLAIRKDGGENMEKDLAYLNGFYPMVATHLDYKYRTPDEIKDYGVREHETQRTKAHNDTIRYLNGLNRLARKYGTRTFTPRDFWTSDLCDKSAQTPAIASLMRYDRDIVEEYYTFAFKKDVDRREGEKSRLSKYGLDW